MAEINVERRPAGGRGPLIALVAVLVLAALAWALLGRGGSDPAPPPPAAADSVAAPADTVPLPPAAPIPADSAPAAAPAPGIVGDDTSGRVGEDSAPVGPAGEGRLGNP